MREQDEAGPMERTTVTVPSTLARKIAHEARRTGRSRSAVVRDALERYWADADAAPLPPWVGMGDSGRTDGSEHVDETIREYLDGRFDRKMGRD